MKNKKRIICLACLCVMLAGVTGCSNGSQSSGSVSSASSQTESQDSNTDSEVSDISDISSNADSSAATDTASNADEGESKPRVVSETENTTFDLPADMAYNTSLKPNVPDDVKFEAELIYTENFETDDPHVVATEVLPLTAETTYADICNLEKFSLVTMDGDMAIDEDRHGQFDYYGIMHTTSDSPATYTLGTDVCTVDPTMNLELVGKDSQIVTDASSLTSTDKDIRVKAISVKTVAYNCDTETQECGTPVMLAFNVSLAGGEPVSYKIGAHWLVLLSDLEDQGVIPDDFKAEDFYMGNNRDYLILKNSDYTLVFAKEGSVVGSISLIKN